MPTDVHVSELDASTDARDGADPAEPADSNVVRLVGAIAVPAERRDLAGGIAAVRWTLRVRRTAGRGSDLFDCVAIDDDVQAAASSWPVDAVVAVDGELRRRFFRSGGRTATRVEVEAHSVELLAEPDALEEAESAGEEPITQDVAGTVAATRDTDSPGPAFEGPAGDEAAGAEGITTEPRRRRGLLRRVTG